LRETASPAHQAHFVRWHGEIFYSLREAQIIIEQWRRHYNTKRPHSALGYKPPAPETIIPLQERPPMN
jgi:transposase InsO family protein